MIISLLIELISLGSVSGHPLHINIPVADSPNKFLPSDPKLDTSDFLRSLGGGGGGDEHDEFYAQSLNDMDKTCRDEATMCRKTNQQLFTLKDIWESSENTQIKWNSGYFIFIHPVNVIFLVI